MLLLVVVSLDGLFKISKSHLPRLCLFRLHLVKPHVAESVPNMLLEAVVEKTAATEPAGTDGRFLDA